MTSHPRSFRFRSLALGVVGAGLLAAGFDGDARAAWPPPESATCADLSTPDFWPNDPGYAPEAKKNGQGRSGAWEFFCFLPERSTGAPPVRQGETASGMSVDLAFRYTQGDPRVVIAVLDSGIKWDEADLIEAAYLNIGELKNHKPTDADGNPCGGEGILEGFDCNGDGQLTVADYKDDPRVGDRNHNGVIDAGDIILAFSDGVDDDGNGYIDDISGWDFLKNDNDPYDDTRYGHGTGEARDSVARANNGISGLGMCPSCRFMPMRVGDSFIVDVNLFAEAAVYATDNGAKVIQEALGTINNSKYAMAALDYAYAKGVTTIASMADENARHHNMPAVNNHTLPTHAIAPGPSPDATSAETFFAFNLCTNYGAHNFLSASSKSCSSGATGNLSGMTGLLYSAGMKYLDDAVPPKPSLTAGEVYQLWMMTADDIDVPESRQASPKYFWSQPGFDQRFGYGRPNANTAVEWVKAGKIPPEVDVVSPYWYEVLYADQVEGPVSIKGSISALRAPSYSYVVEAAPGVQPLDSEFQTIASMDNIKGDTPIDGELAQFDIRTFDVTHEPDSDSPNGENQYTVTVRVRATAHYGEGIGDVHGELRRAYYIHRDPTLVKGFPIRIGGSGESSPKLADIDGDGIRDIVLATSDGEIHAYSIASGSPKPIAGFPVKLPRVHWLDPENPANHLNAPAYRTGGGVDPDIARDGIVATPAIADLDGDGKPEIVVTSYQGFIYVVGSDGAIKPGWPVALPYIPSCPLDPEAERPEDCMDTANILSRGSFASPVLADMDKDGKLDIIQAAFDGKVHVFKADGSRVDGWPVTVRYSGDIVPSKERNRIMTTPAVADLDGDGYPELLVGSNEKLGEGGGAGAFYIIDGKGNNSDKSPPYWPNWPVTMSSFNIFPLVGEGVPNSPVFGDFDGDGVPEAVMHGNVSSPIIVPADPGVTTKLSQTPPNAMPCHPDPNEPEKTVCGLYSSSIFGELSKADQPNTMFPLFAMPSVADIDQDGVLDVIASGGSLNLAINMASKTGAAPKPGENLLAVWSGKTGAMLPGSPMVLEDFTFFNNQAVADMNADGYPEILTGTGGYYVHAYDGCGREAPGFPKFTGQWIIGTVAVGDLDGDGMLEIVAPTRNGWLYAWHTEGRADGNIQWESFHHDNRNTGYAGTPLDQGTTDLAPTPLVCPAEGEETTPDEAQPEADGGCGCSTKPAQGKLGWILGGLAIAGAIARRKKRV